MSGRCDGEAFLKGDGEMRRRSGDEKGNPLIVQGASRRVHRGKKNLVRIED
jgi:hypothetical protein